LTARDFASVFRISAYAASVRICWVFLGGATGASALVWAALADGVLASISGISAYAARVCICWVFLGGATSARALVWAAMADGVLASISGISAYAISVGILRYVIYLYFHFCWFFCAKDLLVFGKFPGFYCKKK
jgi:hypothetical protein